MAVVTPPLFQTLDSVYSGADLGLPYRDLVSEGVAGTADLAVTERGAGPNMSVDVAAGVAWVKGDDSALQPVYRCYNDGAVNLAVAAADATNPRIDLVIAEVRDAGFAGVSTDWRLRLVTGTPAASPDAPATPSNAIALARVSVPANDTTISDSQITDYRPRAGLFAALAVPTVTALPLQPYDGQVVDYLADATNGVVWRLKYRAASASTYKWECIGGSSLFAQVSTGENRNVNSYGDLTTIGPTVTPPLVGQYRVRQGAVMMANGNELTHGLMSYTVGGSAADDSWGATFAGGTSLHRAQVWAENIQILSAPGSFQAKYKATLGSLLFYQRTLVVTPIRVG